MTKFTDHLWSDLARDHGATLAYAAAPQPGVARRSASIRRPRVLAGSTLGLAGIGAALVLALGGPATQAAYAVTTNADGSVTVQLNRDSALPQANAKLASMGTHEQISIQMAQGAATVSGAVTCARASGTPSAPAVKVLVGTNGTEVIASGNTGAGTWHLASCTASDAGATGNSGTAG